VSRMQQFDATVQRSDDCLVSEQIVSEYEFQSVLVTFHPSRTSERSVNDQVLSISLDR